MRAQEKARDGEGESRVPLYAQSIDLVSGDGSEEGAIEAQLVRSQLTKSLRQQRRSKIKEANFLKSMS